MGFQLAIALSILARLPAPAHPHQGLAWERGVVWRPACKVSCGWRRQLSPRNLGYAPVRERGARHDTHDGSEQACTGVAMAGTHLEEPEALRSV